MTVHCARARGFPGGVVAVRDVNLEVEPGELVVLVEPSGCGKSTVLRMVAGFGAHRGAGCYWSAPRHRNVAMVFQNYALDVHMTVRASMGFGLRMGAVLIA